MQLAYASGVARPVSVRVDTFGTGSANDDALTAFVVQSIDMRPRAIIEQLDLRKPIYRPTAAYGHFGRPSSAGKGRTAPRCWPGAFERPGRSGAERSRALADSRLASAAAEG